MPLCSRIPQLGYDAIRYAAERYNSAPMLHILLQHGGNPNGGECAGNPVRRASVCVCACVRVRVCVCVRVRVWVWVRCLIRLPVHRNIHRSARR